MGDFSNYAEQGLQAGRTVRYEVTELVNEDGTHPVVHVEHLGVANKSFMQSMIALAGSDGKGTDEREPVIRHSVKKLENVFHADGAPATDDDIPAFVAALPQLAFWRLLDFVTEDKNYRTAKPKAVAEK